MEKKMNIMQANPKIGSMDAVLDKLYGKGWLTRKRGVSQRSILLLCGANY